MKTAAGKALKEAAEKLAIAPEAALLALDRLLSHVNPTDALKIIFTPENMRAFGEGLAAGAAKSAASKVKA